MDGGDSLTLTDSTTLIDRENPGCGYPAVGTPIALSCPKCGAGLGRAVRARLDSAWCAAKRPVPSETYLICPDCFRPWVASIGLAVAHSAESGVAS